MDSRLRNWSWHENLRKGTLGSRGFSLSESWGRKYGPAPPPLVLSAPALRQRETSGTQGREGACAILQHLLQDTFKLLTQLHYETAPQVSEKLSIIRLGYSRVSQVLSPSSVSSMVFVCLCTAEGQSWNDAGEQKQQQKEKLPVVLQRRRSIHVPET